MALKRLAAAAVIGVAELFSNATTGGVQQAAAQDRSDLIAGLENAHGANLAVTFKPQYAALVNNIFRKNPEMIHEIFRDGMRRTQRSLDRPGPNNSGFEKDVANEVKNYVVPANIAAKIGVGSSFTFGAVLESVNVWENQPGHLPRPNDGQTIHAHMKVAESGPRAGLEHARGIVSVAGGECYSGVPLKDSKPMKHFMPPCPGGQ